MLAIAHTVNFGEVRLDDRRSKATVTIRDPINLVLNSLRLQLYTRVRHGQDKIKACFFETIRIL